MEHRLTVGDEDSVDQQLEERPQLLPSTGRGCSQRSGQSRTPSVAPEHGVAAVGKHLREPLEGGAAVAGISAAAELPDHF